LGTGAGPELTTGPFQPHGILDVRMSLSTLSFFCRRRATATLRYGRNPCVIQADAEPPGRLPPAPGSQDRRSTPSPGDLSIARVWWGFPRLSSIPAPSLSSSRNPQLWYGPCHIALSSYAIATWRQAQVCLQPLLYYGQNRASRPPFRSCTGSPYQRRHLHSRFDFATSARGLLHSLFRHGLGGS